MAKVAGGIAWIAAGLCWLCEVDGDSRHRLATPRDLRTGTAVDVHRRPRSCIPPTNRPFSDGRSDLAVAASAASMAVLVDVAAELPRFVTGGGIALATGLILLSLIVSGIVLWPRMRWTLPLVIGVMTMPAVLVGGVLAAMFGERLLEVPLVALGAAWVAFGGNLLQGRYAAETKRKSRVAVARPSTGTRLDAARCSLIGLALGWLGRERSRPAGVVNRLRMRRSGDQAARPLRVMAYARRTTSGLLRARIRTPWLGGQPAREQADA